VDTARNIVAGQGISSSIAPLDHALKTGLALPSPMTMWAPLYPWLIALFCRLGMPVTLAALAIPLAFSGVILAAAFLLMRRLYDTATAVFSVGLLVQFHPLRVISTAAWSETTAIAFALLAIYFALGSRQRFGPLWALLAGTAAGMAFTARYAMLPLPLVVACAVFAPRDVKRSAARFACAAAGFLLAAGWVLLRNAAIAGHPLGAHFSGSGIALAHALHDLARVFWQGPWIDTPFAQDTVLLSLILAAIVLLLHAYRHERRGNIFTTLTGNGRYLLPIWVALYGALLLYSQAHVVIDRIDVRLLTPATVVLALVFAGAIGHVLRAKPWLPALLALLLVGLAVPDEVGLASAVMRSPVPPVYSFEKSTARSETLAWLANHTHARDLVIAEDGFFLPLHFGPVNILYFDSQRTPPEPVAYADLTEYLNRHRAEYDRAYVVLYNAPSRAAGWGSFFADLEAGRLEQYRAIASEATLGDGQVFRIEIPQ
jgi:cbb3-type cytochrome oxidase subunit 3